MIIGQELDPEVYSPEHVDQVLAEIEASFTGYFSGLAELPLDTLFTEEIERHKKERDAYREYLDLEALEEFGYCIGSA